MSLSSMFDTTTKGRVNFQMFCTYIVDFHVVVKYPLCNQTFGCNDLLTLKPLSTDAWPCESIRIIFKTSASFFNELEPFNKMYLNNEIQQ